MSNYETLIPSTWAEHLKGGKVCLGLDVASTIEDKSNPSSLTVMEQWEGVYYERLVVRWKTEDLDVMESIIRHVLKPIAKSYRKALVVDKSNEKFAANKLRQRLSGEIRVIGFAGNNNVIYEGEKTDAKTAMGSAYCGALEDGLIAMPSGKWLRDDHRLVKRKLTGTHRQTARSRLPGIHLSTQPDWRRGERNRTLRRARRNRKRRPCRRHQFP